MGSKILVIVTKELVTHHLVPVWGLIGNKHISSDGEVRSDLKELSKPQIPHMLNILSGLLNIHQVEKLLSQSGLC